MRSKLLGFVAVVAFPVLPVQVQAADLTFKGDVLTLQGPIVLGDAARFSAAVAAMSDAGQPIKTVALNSPGGLIQEGISMADEVQAQHLDVTVPGNAICASACFLLFAAGAHKTAGSTARIGVHSATATIGSGIDTSDGTLAMARYAAQAGVPEALVGRLVITPSSHIAWLTAVDLQSMGATLLLEQAAQQVEAPQPIQLLGAASPPKAKLDLLKKLMTELPTDITPVQTKPHDLTLDTPHPPVTSDQGPITSSQKMSPGLWASLDGELERKYRNCWGRVSIVGDYIPQFRVIYAQDGSLVGDPILLNAPFEPASRALADSAMNALKRCNPLKLSGEYAPFYNEWKQRVLRFDPKEASK